MILMTLNCETLDYFQWVYDWFGDCVYSSADLASFLCGLCSFTLFLFAFYPQIYHNYKRQSVAGLSYLLLCIWAAGDASNFLGAVFTYQLQTQKLVAAYFLMLDVIFLAQYILYYDKDEYQFISDDTTTDDDQNEDSSRLQEQQIVDEEAVVTENDLERNGPHPDIQLKQRKLFTLIGVGLSIIVILVICGELFTSFINETQEMIIGSVLSWFSGLFYFFSRLPQIIENYNRKSVEALSMTLFIMSILGNLTYGSSILLRFPAIDTAFYASKLPFLIGSLGTLLFDFCILIQSKIYITPKLDEVVEDSNP